MNAQQTPGILGYAIFREGKQTGIERSLPVAKQWVDAEIVPLCAASVRDDLIEALEAVLNATVIGNDGDEQPVEDLLEAWVYTKAHAAIAKATGDAA